ncbi:MAG TPA: hypothetical protein PK992_07205, partial [Planctomycetaceae bacterium]|nr:hypothetical protein [Planctomycetaceae bacterium]
YLTVEKSSQQYKISSVCGAGHSRNFVNADLIAAGLSPLSPDEEALEAGRLFLREVHRFVADRESFAFETTLSGRSYLRMIRDMVADGWEVHLVYLWLPTADACVERMAERVAQGGHDIPEPTIRRRYSRSLQNLANEYSEACTATICYDNSGSRPYVIFTQDHSARLIHDSARYQRLIEIVQP